jgi:hypothetical protein
MDLRKEEKRSIWESLVQNTGLRGICQSQGFFGIGKGILFFCKNFLHLAFFLQERSKTPLTALVMDLSLSTHWLDYLVIVVGLIAAAVGIVVLVRMFQKSRSEPEEISETSTPPASSRAFLRINLDESGKALPPEQSPQSLPPTPPPPEPPAPPESKLPHTSSRDRRKTIAVSEVELTEEEEAGAVAPELIPEREPTVEVVETASFPHQITFPSPVAPIETIEGVHVQAVKVTQLSDTDVRLALEVSGGTLIYLDLEPGKWNELAVTYSPPIFREEESYAPGTRLAFEISGPELMYRTYQFSILYQDQSGQAYRQEIGGMGLEAPILEVPVRIEADKES